MALKRLITVTFLDGTKFAFPADAIMTVLTLGDGAEIIRSNGGRVRVKESVEDIVKLANSTLPKIYMEVSADDAN